MASIAFSVLPMSGLLYTTAIAATAGALFSIVNSVGIPAPFDALAQTSGVLVQSEADLAQGNLPELRKGPAPSKATYQNSDYAQAMAMANQAVAAYQAANSENDLSQRAALTRRERFLWQAAIHKLGNVSPQNQNYEQATLKRTQYQGLLANADKSLASTEGALLKSLIEQANIDASTVHLTVCHLGGISGNSMPTNGNTADAIASHISRLSNSWQTDRRCYHHQGDMPMASPASLIKLPIAIATMDKANQENIALTDKLYIDPSNFTENAEGASVEIDREYTLEQVVTRMINESNNIATNQLIDYVGREAIAQTLKDQGYSDTLVDHKLAGDRILPPNPGTQSNQTTSNDITAMLASTYSLEKPGDETLLKALRTQQDQEMGHQAIQSIGSGDIEWLGEKTGQNDRLIGTTLAVRVGSQRYAATIAIDHGGDPQAIRDIIHNLVNHLSDVY